MTRVFLDYDQKALDDAYDQAVYAPNRDQVLARFASASEAVRRRLGPPQRLAYGAAPIEKLDLYPCGKPGAPVNVFVHGGAWRAGEARNYAFPAGTRIVAHRATAERMREFEAEKEFLLATVNGDRSVYADAELRLPDTVFDDSLRLDLGGRVVELHHFGPGNTPGDAVVLVPEARVAWTGNLVLGVGVPFLIEGGAEPYLRTIERFAVATSAWDDTLTNAASPAGPTGAAPVFSKWIYVPELDVFAGINDASEGVWLYRLP